MSMINGVIGIGSAKFTLLRRQ